MDVALRGKAAITKARIGPSTLIKTFFLHTLDMVLIQRVLSQNRCFNTVAPGNSFNNTEF